MAAIGTLTIEMAANVARLQRDMDSARKSVDGAMAKITKAASSAKAALAALGIGLSVVGISNFVKGVANAADEIGKMAQRTGVAAADFQKLKFAAEMSGVSVNSLSTALQIMSRNLQGATEDSKAASKGFDALNINVKNTDGSLKNTTQLMTEVANRFSRMDDGAQKTALAMQLFGRSGAELIPMLNEGEAGLQKMFKEAERLGIVMSDDLIKASTAFNDSLTLIQSELKGLMISAVGPFIQRLAEITTRFVEARQAGLSFFQSLVRGFTQTTIIEDLTSEISKLEKEIAKLEGARRGPGMQRRGQIQEMNERLAVLRKNLEEAQAKLNEAPPAFEKFTVAVIKSADNLERLANSQRYYNQQTDEFFANEEKKRQAIENSIRVGREMIEDLEFEAKTLSMTNQEREIAIRLRKLEVAGIKEGSAAYEELAARIREAVAGRDAIAEGIEQQRKLAEEWQKTTEEINRTLTDALMRAFESGKGFGKAFKDTLVNMFRTMVLRPILAPIAGGAASAFGTPAIAGAAGSAGMGAGLLGSITMASSVFGTGLAAGFVNALNLNFAGALQAAGSLIGTGTAAGISSGIGMAAGTLMPIVAGAALVLSGLSRRLADVGISGAFGPSGFAGQRFEFFKGGFLRSNKTVFKPLEEDISQGLNQQFLGIRNSLMLMSESLSESSAAISNFTTEIKLSFRGLTEEQIQQKLSETLRDISDEMASLVPNLQNFQRIGESSSETLQRLFNSASAANQAFDTLNYNFRVTTLATADMASQLVDLFGGIDRFGQVTTQFFTDFYPEAERTSIITRQLTEALASLGLQLPDTRRAYRELAEAQDLTTESGRRTYAALLQFSPIFASLTKSADELASAARDASLALGAKILQERANLETRLLTLMGNTTELRRRELESIDETNRQLQVHIWSIEDARQAQEKYQQALSNAKTAYDAATNAVQAALNAVEAIRNQATSDYLSAQDEVSNAQNKINEILRAQALEAKRAAEAMRDLGKSLRDFVQDQMGNAQETFNRVLSRALAGDASAMRALPESARQATAMARMQARTSLEARLAEARILSDVLRVAAIAEATEVPSVAEDDPLLVAQKELIEAQKRLSKALEVANAINAPLVQSQESLIQKFNQAQEALTNAIKEQSAAAAILRQIEENTSKTVDAINDLDVEIEKAKLTAQLAVSATIDTIINADLPDALKQLALGSTKNLSKTIDILINDPTIPDNLKAIGLTATKAMSKTIEVLITDSGLTNDLKEIGLGQASAVSKIIKAIVESNVPDEIKNLSLGSTTALSKAITLTTSFAKILTAEQKAALLEGGGTVYKTIEAAIESGKLTADQRLILNAYDETIKRTVQALASGTLTNDQRAILDAVTGTSTIKASVSLENKLAADGGMLAYSKADVAAAYVSSGVTIAGWLNMIYNYLSSEVLTVRSLNREGTLLTHFEAGGLHSGGMRIVGERGPELEVTGPARYMSNANLSSMLNSGASEEIRSLREENKVQMRALVSLQSRMTRLLERWDGDGLPEERAVA